MNSTLAAHRRRLLLDNPVFDYYPANGDVLVPRFPAAAPVTMTFVRSGATATRVNASGDRVACAADTPRIDYDPDTGRCLGLLIEESRINHFLNSDAPVTQDSASLATGYYTLWMEGTGSVAVAGKTATISGGGTATDGTSVTFQVTVAGTVTYTVTGSPTRVQAENGVFPTSYIPTTGSSVTRNVDYAQFLTTDFSAWYNTSAGTFLIEGIGPPVAGASDAASVHRTIFSVSDGTSANYHYVRRAAGNSNLPYVINTSSVNQAACTCVSFGASQKFKIAAAYSATSTNQCFNGTLATEDISVSLPTVTGLNIGTTFNGASLMLCGHIARIRYYDKRIPDDQLQLMTTAW